MSGPHQPSSPTSTVKAFEAMPMTHDMNPPALDEARVSYARAVAESIAAQLHVEETGGPQGVRERHHNDHGRGSNL
jgi:hypothetical protein